MLKIGDKIPNITLRQMTAEGLQDVKIADRLKGHRSIILGVPGAFSPVCHTQHIPSFLRFSDKLHEMGIDSIYCIAVSDPFVMKTWSETVDPLGKIIMLSDGNGDFAKASGLCSEIEEFGMGIRSHRYVALVHDDMVEHIEIENSPVECTFTSAPIFLKKITSENLSELGERLC